MSYKSMFFVATFLSFSVYAQEGESSLELESNPLTESIRNNDINEFKKHIKTKYLINAISTIDHSPLHEAALQGKLEMLQELIKNGAKIDARDETGNTPLVMAFSQGHFEIAKTLLQKGADFKRSDGTSGLTPLHILAQSMSREEGNPFESEAAKMFLRLSSEGADPRAIDGELFMPTDYFVKEVKEHKNYKEFLNKIEQARSQWLSANSKNSEEKSSTGTNESEAHAPSQSHKNH